MHVKHFKAHIPVSWFSLQLVTLPVSQLFLLFLLSLAPVPAIVTVTMPSCHNALLIFLSLLFPHMSLTKSPGVSSLLATFRLLLSLLRTPAKASGYFCLMSTVKVPPAVEQSCPQFTHEPSSILYFFEWNSCHTVWGCTESGISFYEGCLHMASFFFFKWEHLIQMASNCP